MYRTLLFTLILAVAAGLSGCRDDARRADLVLTNGTLVTVDSLHPQAEAMAIVGDRITALGSIEAIEEWIGPETIVLDLEGKLAIPGFIEGHGHFMGLGRSKMMLDLTHARSWDDIVDLVDQAALQARPGEWILGRGWHQEKWERLPEYTVDGTPTHHSLSAVSERNPVLLTHASGHAAMVNALAMGLAGISAETPSPAGGEIVRDLRGEPTGLLRERAQEAAGRALATYREQMTEEELDSEAHEQIRLAGHACLSNGITSFHDAGISAATIRLYARMAAAGELPVRLYPMVGGGTPEELDQTLPELRRLGAGSGFLNVRSIKQVVDGALGAHGAWLLEPYEDMPSSRGLALSSPAEIEQVAEVALKHGFQVNTHAIGDRGNREMLDLYQRVEERHPDASDLRWRIEHAQHLHPDDIGRFSALGVIASMQGIHCTSDGPWVFKRLGERRAREGAYVWRSLWDSGAVVTNGTDTPVEDINPIASYYATVSRQMDDGTAFFPEQRLSRFEALQSYTLNNAYAAFEEEEKGSLTIGKLADITVLSKNILTVPEDEIPDTRIVFTILGGKVVYAAP